MVDAPIGHNVALPFRFASGVMPDTTCNEKVALDHIGSINSEMKLNRNLQIPDITMNMDRPREIFGQILESLPIC